MRVKPVRLSVYSVCLSVYIVCCLCVCFLRVCVLGAEMVYTLQGNLSECGLTPRVNPEANLPTAVH